MATADTDALNYPHIHIRDVEWLKRTLLVFPHVVRMVPRGFTPSDKPEIQPFCHAIGRRGPLLREARISVDFVQDAQTGLVEQIRTDIWRDQNNFVQKFGRPSAERFLKRISVHPGKLLGELDRFLRQEGLAWESERNPSYLDMHPDIAEAVMATLAFACAANEGLQVVTESPALHGATIGQPLTSIYRAYVSKLKPDKATEDGRGGEDAIQFLVYRRCDASKLTVERLLALNKEWQALADFRQALQDAAERIPRTIRDPAVREQYLNDVVSDVFRKWESDKANLSGYVREIFGEGMLSQSGRLLEKLAEKVFTPAIAGASTAVIGGLTTGALIGATAGFAVGLVTYSGDAWLKARRRERESPYRYLTMIERDGVSFAVGR